VAGILPSLQIFAGNGNGTFQAPQQMWVPGTGFPNWDTIADASAVTIADVDADGKADLVAACQYEWPWGYDPESTAAPIIYYGKYVPVLRGNGNGTFTTAFVSPSIDSGVSRMFPNVHTRDLNGDSQLDLVFAYEGRVDVLFGAGNATFSAGPSYNWPAGSLVLAHFNADGKTDFARAGVGVTVGLGEGSGGFAPPVDYPVGSPWSAPSVETADFNGDGCSDLVVSGWKLTSPSTDGKINVFLNDRAVVQLVRFLPQPLRFRP
jgi:hypothetical protein